MPATSKKRLSVACRRVLRRMRRAALSPGRIVIRELPLYQSERRPGMHIIGHEGKEIVYKRFDASLYIRERNVWQMVPGKLPAPHPGGFKAPGFISLYAALSAIEKHHPGVPVRVEYTR